MSDGDDVPATGQRLHLKTSDIATAADGGLAGAKIASAEHDLDENVLAALERWRDVPPHHLSQLHEALTATSTGEYAASSMLHALAGFTGEQIASDALGIPLVEETNLEAVDLQRGSEAFQVKEGTTALEHARAAAHAHPDVTIVTDAATAAQLHAEHVDAIGIEALNPETIATATIHSAAALDSLHHLTPHIPVLSTLCATVAQLAALNLGQVSQAEAVANVSTMVGSRAVGIYFMGLIAALFFDIPSAGFLPVGLTLVGAFSGKAAADQLLHARIPGKAMEAIRTAFTFPLRPAAFWRDWVVKEYKREDQEFRAALLAAWQPYVDKNTMLNVWDVNKINRAAIAPVLKKDQDDELAIVTIKLKKYMDEYLREQRWKW